MIHDHNPSTMLLQSRSRLCGQKRGVTFSIKPPRNQLYDADKVHDISYSCADTRGWTFELNARLAECALRHYYRDDNPFAIQGSGLT